MKMNEKWLYGPENFPGLSENRALAPVIRWIALSSL